MIYQLFYLFHFLYARIHSLFRNLPSTEGLKVKHNFQVWSAEGSKGQWNKCSLPRIGLPLCEGSNQSAGSSRREVPHSDSDPEWGWVGEAVERFNHNSFWYLSLETWTTGHQEVNHQLEYFQVLPAPPSLSKAQVRVPKVTGVYYPPWEMIHTSCLSVGPRFQLWLRVPRPAILRRRVCVCVCVCVCLCVSHSVTSDSL